MRIVKNKLLPFGDFAAVNLFGFIFVRYNAYFDESLKRHEAIHTDQMKYMAYLFSISGTLSSGLFV